MKAFVIGINSETHELEQTIFSVLSHDEHPSLRPPLARGRHLDRFEFMRRRKGVETTREEVVYTVGLLHHIVN